MKQIVGTANRRISNPPEAEMMKCGIVALSHFFKIDRSTQKLTTGRIHYSTFDVGRSMFDAYSPPKEDSLISFCDLAGHSATSGCAETPF